MLGIGSRMANISSTESGSKIDRPRRWGRCTSMGMPRWFRSRPLILGLVSGAVLFASTPGALAEDSQPRIEENYDYPGAEKILQERGIRLRKGDGHILLVDCNGGTGLAEVWSRKGRFCFRITETVGTLTLDLPEVYLIKGGSQHTIEATVTVDGTVKTVPVQTNTWTSVGEGADPKSGPATLLEFRASA
jgi:hypothetical protein